MIEVKNLTKKYGRFAAVDDISFVVNDGEIVGFLGPNGAGKTTTMNMMTGYISSTNGSVVINGFDILKEPEKAKAQIGYLPDTPPLYGDMRVCEYLNFVCDIKGVAKSKRKAMLEEIYETVKISEVKTRIIKNLSKGYRQRVGLAQALVGFPDVLILDEPTVGLDPKQIIEMRDVIKELGQRHTVILSSHILHEVSAVCDKVIIINDGKIVVQKRTDEFEDIAKGSICVRFMNVKTADEILEYFSENSQSFYVGFDGIKESGSFDFIFKAKNSETDIRKIIFDLAKEKDIPILMMKQATFSLEEIFLKVINNDYSDIDEGKTDEGLGKDKENDEEATGVLEEDKEGKETVEALEEDKEGEETVETLEEDKEGEEE